MERDLKLHLEEQGFTGSRWKELSEDAQVAFLAGMEHAVRLLRGKLIQRIEEKQHGIS